MATKKSPAGEMPFLDHLEELRWRILRSIVALLIGTIIGFFLVQRFDVLGFLKLPIAPYLPDGNLFVTRPTDAFFITLKLAFVLGLVFSAPVIFAQVWSFLSPALYENERRYIVPALIAGTGLFIAGVLMAYLWVLPAALRILLTTFQRDDLEFIITATEYFGFATQLIVAFGLMFELPVFMVLLSGMGLIGPATFARARPFALFVGAILAAMLTPPDILSMLMLMMPVVVLYEVGIIVGKLVWKRGGRERIARVGMVVLLIAGVSASVEAQDRPPPQRPDSARAQDSLARQADSLTQPIDTSAARRLGLPTAPSRSFPPSDSIIMALLAQEGYSAVRYAADSLTLFALTSEIRLLGQALLEREGSILEADSVSFLQADCAMIAGGEPKLFDGETVLVGGGMRYNTCLYRGIVADAFTKFDELGATWYLRGELEVDSATTRIYGEHNDLTSCDLPTPHFHFAASSVKWVSNSILVARPAVLYVRDVPIMWLPFIWQDMKQGRRSGMLVPRFGINEIVRPNSGYSRHISNMGYFFILNDYLDFQASVDWFSGNYTALNGQLRYRWLDRFVQGSLSLSQIWESSSEEFEGGRSMRLQWLHQQSFDQRTRLTANVDYATSTNIIERNSVDPLIQTATLGSRINFSKQYDWGTLTLGASRTQDISNGTITQTLPNLSLSPKPVNIGTSFTWSPAFTFTHNQLLDQRPGIPIEPALGGEPTDSLFPDQRTYAINLTTPLRIGQWNWQNTVSVTDFRSTRPQPPEIIIDPTDSTEIGTRVYGEDFSTAIDWNTSINLPSLFPSTWRLQPSIGVANKTGGPLLIKNRNTGGAFVSQGKRPSFGASLSPTFFGFFPGVAVFSRIRHAFSPRIAWNYRPKATVPEAYARAIAGPAGNLILESPTVHTISFGLNQTFEAKFKQEEADSADPASARKAKLLNIQTSSVSFDFEQAKEPGRTGWTTQTLTNQLTSDLLRGFTLSATHDLWDGPVGFEDSGFDPFLVSLSTRFQVTGATIRNITSLISGSDEMEEQPEEEPATAQQMLTPEGGALAPPQGLDPSIDRLTSRPRIGGDFRSSVTFDIQRRRPTVTPDSVISFPSNKTLGFQMSFAPTPAWSVSYGTQYNFTTSEFGQHIVRLDRELHRWRATFSFIQSPNGNFAFNFFISLTDQQDIKFLYDQRTVHEGG